MRRRRLLALLAAGTAGCAGTPPTRSTASRDGTPTVTPAPVPGVPDPAPGDCPGYGADTRVVCADAAPDAATTMDASAESVSLPATVGFTLHNRTGSPYNTNFYHWRLHKRVEGRWHHVAPTQWPEPLMVLEPGATHTWTVTLSAADHAGEPVPRPQGTDVVGVSALGGGTYAFGTTGVFPGTDGPAVAFATTLELDAPPLSLTPSGRLTDVTVADGRVLGRLAAAGDGEGIRTAVYRLTPAPDAADATPLIPEQAMRRARGDEPLRDALYLATEHPDRPVELHGPTGCHPPFCVDEGYAVRYAGTTYRVTSELADG